MSKCQSESCGKTIKQTPGKRQKLFCNSTCRSNQFAKEKRRAAAPNNLKSITTSDKRVPVLQEAKPMVKKIVLKTVLPPKSNGVVKNPPNSYMAGRLKAKLGIK